MWPLLRWVLVIGSLHTAAGDVFFSEAAEGSSNHKYFEIYNPTDATVDLSEYAFPNVGNAPTTPGEYEFWNAFEDGATIAPGDVFVICRPPTRGATTPTTTP